MLEEAGAPDPERFADDVQESEYQAASQQLLHPVPIAQQAKFRLLLTSFAMFAVLSLSGGSSITELALLVGVIVVHELGHALGMLVFGYTDVRIFFIPLFGAAAAGKKRGAAKWKQAVVLLLGPLPGLIAGTLLLMGGASGLVRTVALQLVAINAFNLLPLAPLDGGQLFRLLIFSRHRALEIGFLLVASLALLAGGLYFKLYISAIVGGFMLLALPRRKLLLAAAARLRPRELPSDPRALDDTQRRALYAEVWKMTPPQWRGKPVPQASMMEQLLDEATAKPAGIGVSFALVIGWAAGIALTVVAAIAFVRGVPANWQRYEDAQHQFSIEMPAKPTETTLKNASQHMLSARLGLGAEYGVTWLPTVPGWEERVHREYGKKLEREVPIPGGTPALIVSYQDHRMWVMFRGNSTTAFIVLTTADDADAERAMRSFRLLQP